MIVLALDASTYVGTVAVLRDGVLVASAEAAMRGEREERLMPAVAATLGAAGVSVDDVDLVACGEGPGSFTSLRIAASIAKGLACARDLPVVAVSSLVLMVAGLDPLPPEGRYFAALDALRGEAYVQLVRVGPAGVAPAGVPGLLPLDEVEVVADLVGAAMVGVDRAISGRPHARGMARLTPAVERWAQVDLASWEPLYGRLAEAQVRWEAAHGRPLEGGVSESGTA